MVTQFHSGPNGAVSAKKNQKYRKTSTFHATFNDVIGEILPIELSLSQLHADTEVAQSHGTGEHYNGTVMFPSGGLSSRPSIAQTSPC